MLSGAGPSLRQDRIQRLKASVSIAKNEVVSASVSGGRPPGNLRSGTGDHTTAYTTFKHMARNNVLGFSPDVAVKNLVLVLQRIQQMPGYANSRGVTRRTLDAYAKKWIEYGESLKAPHAKDLQLLMEATVSLRNAVPMTAYKYAKSSGGHGEASSGGGLDWAEFMVQKGKWKTRADFRGNPLHNAWATFDFSAPNLGSDADKWARVLRQHILSMRESYPRLFEISGLYSMDDLESYLKTTVLPQKFSTAFAKKVKTAL